MPITIKNEDILTGLEKFTVDVRKFVNYFNFYHKLTDVRALFLD